MPGYDDAWDIDEFKKVRVYEGQENGWGRVSSRKDGGSGRCADVELICGVLEREMFGLQ